MTIRQEIVAEALKRFKESGKKTIARAIYNENPQVWPNLDACYSSVRKMLGVHGDRSRKKMKNKKHFKAPEKPGDVVTRRFPNGLRHNKDFGAYPLRGVKRALLLFDVHVPYHDEEALELAVQHGIDSSCDCVILVGDFMDFYACSFWEKDPRQRDFAGELNTGREMLKSIREAFPGKQIIYKLGNHEERYERWMIAKAPELLGVEDFQIQKLLRLDELNIRMMDYRAPITLGKLNIIHGHEFGKSMTNPVNPSRGLFLKGKSNSICGHYHQSSSHNEKTIEQKIIGSWSSGCLCDMHPDYAPMNNWNHGFIEVEMDGDDFTVHNYKILNGRIYT